MQLTKALLISECILIWRSLKAVKDMQSKMGAYSYKPLESKSYVVHVMECKQTLTFFFFKFCKNIFWD